jgi:methylenetetrahydrofolate dehydrogenase (NADP+)/methenyltetrahydrofolate cyclohydrolase
MKLLDGKKLSQKILKDLKKELKESKLKLAIVLVGNNPDSKKFIKQKQKACQFIGIDFKLFKFPAKIQEAKLLKEIKEIIKDSSISGIVIQLPLPKRLNTEKILKSIPKEKDAEIISPVVCAISRILKEYKISLRNKKIVLIGKGRLVGQPVASWLRKQNLKFSSINKIKQADVVISGMGRANFIKGEMIKKGAIIIDVGEDVDFESVSKKAGYITPTPGGVGPMTVACLLKNLVDSKK